MAEGKIGRVEKISGPLVVASGMSGCAMYDVVEVSDMRLIGEIIELRGDYASIQVYEETQGIGPGAPVYPTGEPLSVWLGPGLLESIYDGIQRPLSVIREKTGDFIGRGVKAHPLDLKRKWRFRALVKNGDYVSGGDIIGEVQETDLIVHRILVPPYLKGTIIEIKDGEYTVEEEIGRLREPHGSEVPLRLAHRWPVRIPRPIKKKLVSSEPLESGQRVLDTFFPVVKGGTACVPGPFGSGKTVIQHQLAKYADAQVIVYVGCGERGNEMTDVLTEFPELKDPRTGKPLMLRTVLIANTSNMPVAAREASVYTGITIAEYFRDMGYSVALMADSTSRWAEAMREISGRLEEMPGEEGYPAYLGRRIAEFYERAGKVICLSGTNDERIGALTVIGAVSPPGGDLGDPVVQSTLRVVRVFWSLEDSLAYSRHFPAISWLNSYTLYEENIRNYFDNFVSPQFNELRREAMRILQQEAELQEIVRLVGAESLSYHDRLILETARSIREDFLQQNAFDEVDTYCSLRKQFLLLRLVMSFYYAAKEVIDKDIDFNKLATLPVREDIARAKYIPEPPSDKKDEYTKFEKMFEELEEKVRKEIRGLAG